MMHSQKLSNIACRLTVALLLAFAVWSCSDNDNSDEPQQLSRRCVLVYMLADNSLGHYGYDLDDIGEMERWARTGNFNGCDVMVYHVASGGEATLESLTPQGMKVEKRYEFDPEVYSVDVSRMRQVIRDMKSISPAESYGIILWSHSDGWQENKYSRSWGQDRTMTMKISSMAKALEGTGWEFIYFDSCHGITVEVVYELRHLAPIIAGSTAELPATGMPYESTLPYFLKDKADITGAARTTFEHYDAQPGSMRSCTMSVVDTGHLDELAEATRAIMQTAPALPENYCGRPYMVGSCTIYDMADYIHHLDVSDQALIARWDKALEKCVVYHDATPSMWQGLIDLTGYCGMGSWIARDRASSGMFGYMNQAWWKDVISYNPLLTD